MCLFIGYPAAVALLLAVFLWREERIGVRSPLQGSLAKSNLYWDFKAGESIDERPYVQFLLTVTVLRGLKCTTRCHVPYFGGSMYIVERAGTVREEQVMRAQSCVPSLLRFGVPSACLCPI